MTLWIPVNKWTVAAAGTLAAWRLFVKYRDQLGSAGWSALVPRIVGLAVFFGTAALWIGLLAGAFL